MFNVTGKERTNMKKLITVALALALMLGVFVFTGCDYTEIDEEALGNKVLAVVNGEEILRKEWSAQYDYMAYMYQYYYGYTIESNPEIFEQLKTDTLDSIIKQKLWEQKAKAAKYFEYTDEQRAEATATIEEEIAAQIKSNADNFYDAVKDQDDAEDYEYYKNAAEEKYYADLEESGSSKEQMIQDELENMAFEKFKEDHLKDVTVLEGDVLQAYADLKKEQIENFFTESDEDKNVQVYDYDAFVKAWNNGDRIAIIPDGYVLVQHILISYGDETAKAVSEAASKVSTEKTALDKLNDELTKLKDELAKLTDEDAKKEKQEAIDKKQKEVDDQQKVYDDAVAAHKAARTTAEEAIKDDAQAVLDSVKGADEAKFIQVMIEKTQDSMNTEELAKKGYLVGKEDGMVEEFNKASLALENDGDISDLVATDYGYHIIRRIKALEEHNADNPVSYSDLKEDLEKDLIEEKKSEKWEKDLTEWYDAAEITIHKKWLKDYDI